MEATPSSPAAMTAGSASPAMAQPMAAGMSSQATGSCPQVTATGYEASGLGSQAASAPSRPAGRSRVRKRKQPPIYESDSEDSSDEMDIFLNLLKGGAEIAQIYCDQYLCKAPPRISLQTGMGWLNETLKNPKECHNMLRMNTTIFMDLHGLLVERYGLKPSSHMNTYEMLGIFLFILGGCESNRRAQNRFKHSGETISRKFHEGHRGMEPNTPKEKFNRIHSSIRNVVERSFGVWKMKWQILYKMPSFSMLTQKKVVAATMVLHNFIREHAAEDLDFACFDRDPNYVPTIPDRYNKYAVSPHASNDSTDLLSWMTMDTFRDEMATSISLAWN